MISLKYICNIYERLMRDRLRFDTSLVEVRFFFEGGRVMWEVGFEVLFVLESRFCVIFFS